MSEVEVQILPADEGARPWLREVAHAVPVLWDGDPARLLGMARVEARDGALVATIELTDDGLDQWVRAEHGHNVKFGVHGQILRSHVVDGVKVVDEIDLRVISAEAAA